MPTFTPVEHDPFAPAQAGGQLQAGGPLQITVRPQGQNGPVLTPVEHDPFASPDSTASIGQQLATSFLNVGPAASQGTNPDIGRYGNPISSDVHESDTGEILYRDQSGRLVPTDTNTQVAIRDPADQRVKIYARTPDTNESAPVSAARVLAQGMGAGAPTARPGIPSMPPSAGPKASDVFSTAKPFYREFTREASQVDVPAQTASDFAGRIRGALDKANFIPELATPVYKAVDILDNGEPLTLDAMQNVKRVVGRSFASPDKNVRDAAAVASREIGKIIGEVSPEAGSAIKTADEIHSTAMALQELQRKQGIAGLRQGRAGYGGNINAVGQVLSPIVEKSINGRFTGFKPDEIQAMRSIVEHSHPGAGSARAIGMASPTKGQIPTFAAVGAAFATGNPLPLAIPVLGAASNRLAKVLDARQFDRLKTLVAKRSPAYAEAVSKAVTRYENEQMGFVSKPSPGSLSKYVNASRALSYGLNKDGISISAGDLIRAVQGPINAYPSDE